MAVITISRESGARGNYIGHALAKRLGYLYVDKEVIHEVSVEYGVGHDEFERIYEQVPGILERYDHRNREIVQLFGHIIQGLAQRDNMVIVGRGSFAVLRDFADVLNVRVTATSSVRVQRLQQDYNLNMREAQTMLDRLDNERRKYIDVFHNLNWADARLYDLCVNTGKLDIDQMVELILQTLNFLEESRDANRPLARDLAVDPILSRAIGEALNLLEAAARVA